MTLGKLHRRVPSRFALASSEVGARQLAAWLGRDARDQRPVSWTARPRETLAARARRGGRRSAQILGVPRKTRVGLAGRALARAARFRLAMGNAATREERRERREPSAPAHSCSALMLGLDNAGKSAVLARLCGEEVRTLLPTRGGAPSAKWAAGARSGTRTRRATYRRRRGPAGGAGRRARSRGPRASSLRACSATERTNGAGCSIPSLPYLDRAGSAAVRCGNSLSPSLCCVPPLPSPEGNGEGSGDVLSRTSTNAGRRRPRGPSSRRQRKPEPAQHLMQMLGRRRTTGSTTTS